MPVQWARRGGLAGTPAYRPVKCGRRDRARQGGFQAPTARKADEAAHYGRISPGCGRDWRSGCPCARRPGVSWRSSPLSVGEVERNMAGGRSVVLSSSINRSNHSVSAAHGLHGGTDCTLLLAPFSSPARPRRGGSAPVIASGALTRRGHRALRSARHGSFRVRPMPDGHRTTRPRSQLTRESSDCVVSTGARPILHRVVSRCVYQPLARAD